MCHKSICLMMLMVLGIAVIPAAVQAQVENLLLNGSFEEDEEILDDPAWEQWCTWGYEDGVNSTVEIDETEAIDGERSLRVEPLGATNWHFIVLYQSIPMEVGKTYTASFWARAEEPRPLAAKMKATDNSVDWGPAAFELTTEWAEYSMTSEAKNASVKLEVHCAGSEVPFWIDFFQVYEGDYVAGIQPSGMVSPNKAGRPTPADQALIDEVTTELNWRPGASAVSHRVYFGESPEAVEEGQMEPILTSDASLEIGQTDPYPAGLTPGATYYWRVDEVNDLDPDSPWTGDVWSFRVRPLTAWNPTPADGIQYVALDQELTWDYGMGVLFHTVHFSETLAEVNEPAAGSGAMSTELRFTPPALAPETTYYWRVDEFSYPSNVTHVGDVWSFTTVPEVAVSDPDLIGWWTLDEGMGTTAVDWSGHDRHGRILGDAAWTYGVHGGALELSGKDSYVRVGEVGISGAAPRTVAGWARANRTDLTAWTDLFGFTGPSGNGGHFDIEALGDTENTNFGWYGLHVYGWERNIIPIDLEWHHLAATYDGTTASWYADGVLVGSEAATVSTPDNVHLGKRDDNSNCFPGAIDDVRIYNRALTEAEIAEVMRGDLSLAWAPTPAPDAMLDIREVDSLEWSAGETAVSHDVYLGGSRQAVVDADRDSAEFQGNQAATRFVVDDLVRIHGGDYYWRIDEVAADGTVHTGNTWRFSILPYLLVEDFESYDDDMEAGTAIYQTWVDGVENDTGSYVGYEQSSNGTFGETRIVRSGRQSMPLQYDNTGASATSETERTFSPAQDWTAEGVTTLLIHFRGESDNTGQLYAKINGVEIPYNGDPADIAAARWTPWAIDLASVGVDVSAVQTLAVGIDGGQTGMLYVDDIQLTKP